MLAAIIEEPFSGVLAGRCGPWSRFALAAKLMFIPFQ